MPKPFMLGVEVEEVALGLVMRKLNTLPGVVGIHLNFDQHAKPNGHDRQPKKNGAGHGGKRATFEITGQQFIAELLKGGRKMSSGQLRDAFAAAGRQHNSVNSCLYHVQKNGVVVRTAPDTYALKKKKRASAKGGLNTMARVHVYRTYRWIDKDPIIFAVKTVVQDEKLKYSAVHNISGVAAATLDGWFNGGVRKPQNATVTALTSALGYVRRDRLMPDGSVEVGFEKARTLDWKVEAKKQAAFMLKQQGPKKKRKRKAKKKNGAGH